MTREQLEAQIADYLDGLMNPEEMAAFERHLCLYPDLEEFVRDAAEGMESLRSLEEVEPPPDFYTRIDAHLSVLRQAAEREKSSTGFLKNLSSLFAPILHPRFVMGMAMTVLSVSMIGQLTGTRIDQVTAEDLRPSVIWSSVGYRAERVWDRVTKYYESMRVVYEMRTQVQEWKTQLEQDRQRAAARLDDPDTELNGRVPGGQQGQGDKQKDKDKN